MLRRTRTRSVDDAPSAIVARWAADRRALLPDGVAAVLARNSVASVVQGLDGGRVRARRSRYAYAGDTLYLPAWRHLRWFRHEPPLVVEVHVSELDGLEQWSYVFVRGVVTALHPSEDAVENEAWQVGVAKLNRALRSFGRVPEPAGTSYGILRVGIVSADGVTIKLA